MPTGNSTRALSLFIDPIGHPRHVQKPPARWRGENDRCRLRAQAFNTGHVTLLQLRSRREADDSAPDHNHAATAAPQAYESALRSFSGSRVMPAISAGPLRPVLLFGNAFNNATRELIDVPSHR